ncbi:MAG: hypothetical protein KGH93_02725 [Patescibacteria group bacterium]|nr:hypothetical protein [Patescibacteria group bacterium]MDE1946086.1 hypothetical protein [Patescibacteria group bacterium]
MDPYQKQLFERMTELAEENNKILRSLRNAHRWSVFLTSVYWILIIGVAVGGFYYLEPYVDTVLRTYSSIVTDLGNVKEITSKIPGFGTSTKK